jgi:Arylsulfotransferase (ASST)
MRGVGIARDCSVPAVPDQATRDGRTRRQLLRGAGGVAALLVTGCGATDVLTKPQPKPKPKPLPRIQAFAVRPTGAVGAFHSQPDLRPPTLTATADPRGERLRSAGPGFLFLGPGPVSLSGSGQYGPLIVDRAGMPVWFRPLSPGLQVANFSSARYRGKPVLVWWEGKVLESGYGQGEAVMVDENYRELARVRAANGRSMDLHALTLTADGTALFTCYPRTVHMDLSSIDAPRNSQVLESIIQEVDIASGRLLFEWRGLQHIPVSSSQEPHAEPYDYLHVNSIEALPDGNLLVSARHTWSIYKLDRRTGKIIWTLGGKRGQFHIGRGAQFAWQHDARQPSAGTLTVFDNGTNGPVETEHQSRGLVLNLDERHRTVTLRKAYTPPEPILAGAMGSVQIVSPDRVMVGWGVASQTTEFASDGTLLLDIGLPAGMYSYRGLWLPWQGNPHHRPAVAAGRDRGRDTPVVYASWNGATEVTGWQVAAGSRHDELRPVGVAQRHGFETVIPLPAQLRYASVTALGHSGRALRRSPVIRL